MLQISPLRKIEKVDLKKVFTFLKPNWPVVCCDHWADERREMTVKLRLSCGNGSINILSVNFENHFYKEYTSEYLSLTEQLRIFSLIKKNSILLKKVFNYLRWKLNSLKHNLQFLKTQTLFFEMQACFFWNHSFENWNVNSIFCFIGHCQVSCLKDLEKSGKQQVLP